MRKPDFCICENQGADQLCGGNRTADQRLCFRSTDSTIRLLSKSEISKPLTIFCDCTARFVSDLAAKPKTSFLALRLIVMYEYLQAINSLSTDAFCLISSNLHSGFKYNFSVKENQT